MTWFGISVTYIRFYQGFKYQGFDRSKLPYASKLQPYAAYYAAAGSWFICFVSASSFSLGANFKLSGMPTVVQRMESIPEGRMGYGYLCDQLYAIHTVPHPVSNLEDQDRGPNRKGG
jgi:hypothetical protein